MCCSLYLKFHICYFMLKKKLDSSMTIKKACFTSLKMKTRNFIKHYKLLIKYTRKLSKKLFSKHSIFR